ncbi:hypothetical protein MCEL_03890 [Mycolicibacterium celeriflavum]|uniref:Uncharacterized protein n=1 Tax=Mycolicibacterium celeriflavum TaxID=1249101 RepID=A0A7I7RC38_MYCCF|nr:hypothetical protein MCEL_03890 [Mycolicibacterium celeriflavum]
MSSQPILSRPVAQFAADRLTRGSGTIETGDRREHGREWEFSTDFAAVSAQARGRVTTPPRI